MNRVRQLEEGMKPVVDEYLNMRILISSVI